MIMLYVLHICSHLTSTVICAHNLYVDFFSGFLCVHYLLLLQWRGEWTLLVSNWNNHQKITPVKHIIKGLADAGRTWHWRFCQLMYLYMSHSLSLTPSAVLHTLYSVLSTGNWRCHFSCLLWSVWYPVEHSFHPTRSIRVTGIQTTPNWTEDIFYWVTAP